MDGKKIRQGLRLTGTGLKKIAAAAMLTDHAGVLLLEKTKMYWPCRAIGRLAFPLYCFLLVEGFMHTGNRKSYGRNLLFFALLSEIPFDLAFWGKVMEVQYQNVYFTLFLGLCMLEIFHWLKGSLWKQAGVLAIFCLMAEALCCDYGGIGMLLIAMLYYGRVGFLGWLPAAAVSFWESLSCLGTGVLSLLFICRYDGERGVLRHKYFWYFFYPLHLMALYFISYLLRGK